MWLTRHYQDTENYLEKNKVLAIYGPRRVGKTSLLKHFLQKTNLNYLLVSGDNLKIQNILSSGDFDLIREFLAGYELLVIDEAQNIPNVGMGLKIIVDQIEQIKVIATGSSSFDLANQIGEPLVGRKKTLKLYPLSQLELKNRFNKFELRGLLAQFLIYGSYPEVITANNNAKRKEILIETAEAYLFKDILALENIQNPKLLLKLLKLLAFQLSSEVSLNELSRNLGIDVKTVIKYLDLLEKSFVIRSLSGFSRNLQKEISRKEKYYFLDLGIRNAVIANFNDLETRNDLGQLWENFLFIERIKRNQYLPSYANVYFWRTYDQKELDLIEEEGGSLRGYEFKWGTKKKTGKSTQEFLKTYSNSAVEIIDRDNYLDFLS
jgi:predicted AAA+ superfamily ATPase